VVIVRRPLLCLLGLTLLTGCSSGDDGGTAAAAPPTAASTPSSTAPSSSAAPAPTSASAAPAVGCPQTGSVPDGVTSAPTLDVDGDGRPDTEWIAPGPAADGSVRFGVQTASGGVFDAVIRSASPVARSVLVADVTGHGELVALAGDGRAVQLWAISDCALVPVQNSQGQQYTFDLGFTGHGTGVGCADVDGDGVRDLVGLLADGTSVTSTAIELDGPRATNGAAVTVPDATAEQLDLAHQVTCGDLTTAADGVSSGP
jgi:hypothetical protein